MRACADALPSAYFSSATARMSLRHPNSTSEPWVTSVPLDATKLTDVCAADATSGLSVCACSAAAIDCGGAALATLPRLESATAVALSLEGAAGLSLLVGPHV